MSTLTGTKIKDTYPGLLKTNANDALSASGNKVITDGLGNSAPLALSQSSVCVGSLSAASTVEVYSDTLTIANQSASHGITMDASTACFVGPMDFSGATVTGLPTGSAGLVNGTGTDSLKNSDSLVTLAATAGGACSIVLGNGACSNNDNDIIIGNGSYSVDDTTAFKQNVVIGSGAKNDSIYGGCHVIIGANARAAINEYSIIIGPNAVSCRGTQIVMGWNASAGNCSQGYNAISIGSNSCTKSDNTIAIGRLSCSQNDGAIAIGECAKSSNSDRSVAIGKNACTVGWSEMIAIGCGAYHEGNLYGGAAIGCGAKAWGPGVSIGNQATTTAYVTGISIGDQTCVTAGRGIAIGSLSSATATCAVAIGHSITAAKADTVSMKELELQTVGGGLYLKSPNGTEYKITVSDAGELVIT